MSEHPTSYLEALQPNLSPEETCLTALLDLKQFQKIRPGAIVSDFYTAFTGEAAPEGLTTSISIFAAEQDSQDPPHYLPQKSYVEGFEVALSAVVDFNAREAGVQKMLNLDFVKTPEGIQLLQRQLFNDGDGVSPRYTRRLSEQELTALAHDVIATKELIIEEDAELMKLGPLVEEQTEDGSRRFHVGDILSITTGRFVSPRGMEGIYDILGFMTDDNPSTTQLGRFAEECKPYLERQLGQKIDFEIPDTIKDRLSLYKWLNAVTESLGGDAFMKVDKLDEKDHATIDAITELQLDHGPEIMKKVISIDPTILEKDED